MFISLEYSDITYKILYKIIYIYIYKVYILCYVTKVYSPLLHL